MSDQPVRGILPTGCVAAAGRPYGGRLLMSRVQRVSDGHPAVRRSYGRRAVGAFGLGLTLVFASGCAGMHEYDDVLHNRNRCNPCEGSNWDLYRDMSSRCNPCEGDGACGCRPAAAPCAPRPVCAPRGCASTSGFAPGGDFPADAKPGEAWCRVVIPAKYETIREPVPTICAGVERDWVPPVTRVQFRSVCAVAASDQVVRTPGASRTDEMCAEGCPARTQTRTVCEQGPCGPVTRCETVTIPATMSTTRREVCVHPPGRHEVRTPAQYLKDPCLVEVTPGRWVDRPIRPVVEMRTRVVCVSPERVEWRRNPTCEVPGAPAATPLVPIPAK